MNQPPKDVVDNAIHEARRSPCAKRKVGAAVFLVGDTATYGLGYNGPSGGRICDGSASCRASCRDRCVHAETRALHEFMDGSHGAPFDIVHVKLDAAGDLEACTDGPSCVRCSALILDVGIVGVWLYEEIERAAGLVTPERVGNAPIARWRRYTAEDFHSATCRNLGVY